MGTYKPSSSARVRARASQKGVLWESGFRRYAGRRVDRGNGKAGPLHCGGLGHADTQYCQEACPDPPPTPDPT
eukprot:scaffold27146_cov32-Tisochrysis_lutea.AAC.3